MEIVGFLMIVWVFTHSIGSKGNITIYGIAVPRYVVLSRRTGVWSRRVDVER